MPSSACPRRGHCGRPLPAGAALPQLRRTPQMRASSTLGQPGLSPGPGGAPQNLGLPRAALEPMCPFVENAGSKDPWSLLEAHLPLSSELPGRRVGAELWGAQGPASLVANPRSLTGVHQVMAQAGSRCEPRQVGGEGRVFSI